MGASAYQNIITFKVIIICTQQLKNVSDNASKLSIQIVTNEYNKPHISFQKAFKKSY